LHTRLKRDEVLAELGEASGKLVLNVHCHVSGGLVIGRAKWRYGVFCSELPLALEAIRYGDKAFFEQKPQLDQTQVLVHFKSTSDRYNKIENWGTVADYKI
jgi:proteinaceous RNase P